jgi:hypothetical protein
MESMSLNFAINIPRQMGHKNNNKQNREKKYSKLCLLPGKIK